MSDDHAEGSADAGDTGEIERQILRLEAQEGRDQDAEVGRAADDASSDDDVTPRKAPAKQAGTSKASRSEARLGGEPATTKAKQRGVKREREPDVDSNDDERDLVESPRVKQPPSKKRRVDARGDVAESDTDKSSAKASGGKKKSAQPKKKKVAASKKESSDSDLEQNASGDDDDDNVEKKKKSSSNKGKKTTTSSIKKEASNKGKEAKETKTAAKKKRKSGDEASNKSTKTKKSVLNKRKNAQEIQAKSLRALLNKPKGLPRIVPKPVFDVHATPKEIAMAEEVYEQTLKTFSVDFNLEEDIGTALYNPGNVYQGFSFVAETTAGATIGKMLLAVAKKMMPNFELECTPTGLNLQSRSMNAIGWCMGTISKDLFEHYYCPDAFSMVLDPISFSNKFKDVKANTVLRLLVVAGDDSIHIEIVNRTNGINAILTEHLVADEDSAGDPERYSLNDILTSFVVCLDPQLLKTVAMMLASMEGGDRVTIVVDRDNLSFVINMNSAMDEQRITVDNRFSGELATIEVKGSKTSRAAGGAAAAKKKAAAAAAAATSKDETADGGDDDKDLLKALAYTKGSTSSFGAGAGSGAGSGSSGRSGKEAKKAAAAAEEQQVAEEKKSRSAASGSDDSVEINDDRKGSSSKSAKEMLADQIEQQEDADEEKERRRKEALAGVQIMNGEGCADDQIQSTYQMKTLLELLVVMIKIKSPISMLINKNDNDVLLIRQALGLHCEVRYVLCATAGPASDILS
jgi:hypothetical protein